MDKKHLAIALSKLAPASTQDVALEQYQTDGELAATLLWNAYLAGDIQEKIVADFGCGNGILGIGAQLLGAKNVSFIDIDKHALAIAKKNAHNKGAYYCGDVTLFNQPIDTVLMNPPFGVQKRKADKHFLEHAMTLSTAIYSIHKIESKSFIQQLARDHNWKVQSLTEHTFLLKKTLPFHKKKHYAVQVGIWVLRKV